MTAIKFKSGNQTAIVKEENGTVIVVRGDQETEFSEKHTLQSVAESFKEYGWKEVKENQQSAVLEGSWLLGSQYNRPPLEFAEDTPIVYGTPKGADEYMTITSYSGGTDEKVVDRAVSQKVPVAVQKEVDEFLKLHEQIAELNKQAKVFKDNVRAYMQKNKVKEIYGTEGKKVELQDAAKSNSTSVYTDYDYVAVSNVLRDKVLEDVSEVRINADTLNSLIKTKKLPTEVADKIKKLKISEPGTPKFVVKQ
jgi:hypothetical protein